MRQLLILTILLALGGCSDSEKLEAGIKGFIESCNGPVSGRLTASTYSNQLELSCAEFKPMKVDVNPKKESKS